MVRHRSPEQYPPSALGYDNDNLWKDTVLCRGHIDDVYDCFGPYVSNKKIFEQFKYMYNCKIQQRAVTPKLTRIANLHTYYGSPWLQQYWDIDR